MATGRHRIARDKEIYIFPDKTLEFNPGDSVPPIIEVDRAAESLEGGPVFEGTDVPVEYVHYYLNVRNLYTFLSDYPSVSPEQALTAIEERLLEDIDALINSDREYAGGTPRFNGTRMTVNTLFQVLADGDNIETFLSEYDTSITPEQSANLIKVAKRLVEFYAYKIAFERMGSERRNRFRRGL